MSASCSPGYFGTSPNRERTVTARDPSHGGRRKWLVSLWVVLLSQATVPLRGETLPSPPEVGAAVDGRFLGLPVDDWTHDRFLQNAWLRAAIRDGRRRADAFRRHQLDRLSFHDGQHPESGEEAVLVVLVPKPHEAPDPPMEPVAVRRWQPPPNTVRGADELAELQRSHPPRSEDLDRLRDMLSGDRYQRVSSLVRTVRITLVFVGAGLALIVLAGAYRSFAYVTTRWDMLAEARKDDQARRSLRAARPEPEHPSE